MSALANSSWQNLLQIELFKVPQFAEILSVGLLDSGQSECWEKGVEGSIGCCCCWYEVDGVSIKNSSKSCKSNINSSKGSTWEEWRLLSWWSSIIDEGCVGEIINWWLKLEDGGFECGVQSESLAVEWE